MLKRKLDQAFHNSQKKSQHRELPQPNLLQAAYFSHFRGHEIMLLIDAHLAKDTSSTIISLSLSCELFPSNARAAQSQMTSSA